MTGSKLFQAFENIMFINLMARDQEEGAFTLLCYAKICGIKHDPLCEIAAIFKQLFKLA